MIPRFAWSIAISFALALPALAKGPFEAFTIGNWNGGAYTNDATGSFSHCAAYVPYRSGIDLFISINAQGGWNLAFHHEGWQLVSGQSIPVDLTFDGSGPVRVNAVPLTKTLAIVPMPGNSTLLKAFMDAQIMNAFAEGNIFTFNLEGTLRVIPLLVDCVKRHIQPSVAKKLTSPTPAMSRARPSPPPTNTETPSPANSEAERERSKLITEAAAEHSKCLRSQMREIVPYSNENAETLAQVVITKCADSEKKFVNLGMALFNTSRAEMESSVGQALETQKKKMVAEIVSFRAELNKAIMSQPKSDDNTNEQGGKKSHQGI